MLCQSQSNINSQGFRSLREGEPVEFNVEAGPDGRSKAVNVTGPAGAAPQVIWKAGTKRSGGSSGTGASPGGPCSGLK